MELWEFVNRLRRGFTRETSELPDLWRPENPSVGQCHVSSLLIQQRFGGAILMGLVHPPGDGQVTGTVHFWNSVNGCWIDVTRDQFPINYELSDIMPADDPNDTTVHKAGLLLLSAGFQAELVG